MTLFYHDSGEGYPILWVHGFPLSAEVYTHQTAIEGYRHIRPDLPGFGRTPAGAEPTSMATYATHLIELLDELKIDKTVVAGLSMGGYIAMELVRKAPERVAALLLLDSRETPDTPAAAEKRRESALEVERSGISSVVDSMLPKMVWNESLLPAVRTILESSSAEGVAAALRALAARPDSTETLRTLQAPALVIVGDRDELTPFADGQRMAAMIPHAELAPIAHAAHLANYEQARQVNPIIAAWLDRNL